MNSKELYIWNYYFLCHDSLVISIISYLGEKYDTDKRNRFFYASKIKALGTSK